MTHRFKRIEGEPVWRAAALAVVLAGCLAVPGWVLAQTGNPSPPAKTVKLIFVHHSTGENWLADENGGLARALAKNNYFVSDTNYGWGPDGIGDRTDITDWPEWFSGSASGRYLKALYAERGKRSPYARTLADPGGENQIVMFKSCFPNSNLEGRPTDPPRRGDGLTVSNAKAIYNELLRYFASRPDKLFIAVTAPPLQDRTHAANARAFNNWLVNEWLAGYRGSNVAVFDFYNVLTGPDNHHRFQGGKIEHVVRAGRDTLFYPTNGDDHPSAAGNRRATAEFVSLLNVSHNRWEASPRPASGHAPPVNATLSPGPPEPAIQRPAPPSTEAPPAPQAARLQEPSRVVEPLFPLKASGVIDDFEGESDLWTSFLEEGKNTRLAFERDLSRRQGGTASLRIEYEVAPQSWATCSLVYPQPRDWKEAKGLRLYIHAPRAGQPLVIVAYQGKAPEELSHFEYRTETDSAAVKGWQRVDIPWDGFLQPSWEGDGKARFHPGSAMGMALVIEGGEGNRRKGELWVDSISLLPR